MNDHLNTILNQRYRLVEFLGHGNFGDVYRGLSVVPGRENQPFCIRLLAPDNPLRRALLDAFLDLAKSDVPYLLPWIEVGRAATGPATGYTFLVSALAEPLTHRLASGGLGPEEAGRMALHLATALEALHEQGLAYTKLSPTNIVMHQEQWLLSDREMLLGLHSTWLEDYLGRPPPDYVAPELWLRRGGPPVDMWALGMMLLLSLGHPLPWTGTGWGYELCMGPLPLPSLPPPLDLIVRGCLQREPQRRWAAANVLQALRGEPLVLDTSWRNPFSVEAPLPRRAAPVGCQELEGHYSEIRALAMLDSDLVSGSLDGSLYLWSLEDHRFRRLGAHEDAIRRVAVSPRPGTLASACRGGEVRVWDMPTRSQIAATALPGPVRDVQFDTASDLWILLDDGRLYRWQLSQAAPEPLPPLPMATCLCPRPDGLAWGRMDGQILDQGHTVGRHQGPVTQLLQAAGEQLSASLDGAVQRGGKPCLQTPTELWCVTARKGWVATAGLNRVIYVSPPDGPLFALHGHSLGVTGLAFSADGEALASCSRDRTILLWNLAAAQREEP